MSQPIFQEPSTPPAPAAPKPQAPAPQPNAQQQPEPKAEPKADAKPPWGDDFDADKAWNLIQNLRGDKDKQKAALDQAAADRAELEKLRNEKLTVEEKALKEAVEQAKAEARSEAEAEWRPRAQELQLRTIAGDVIKDADQLDAFVELINPAKFAGENGDIDKEKVMGHLTALFAAGQQQHQAPQWGQYSAPGQPPQQPGDAGRAEAQRRRDRNKQPQK